MSNRTCGAVNTCWYGAQSYLSSNSQGFKIWKMEIWRQSTFLPEAGLWKQLGEWVRRPALSLSFKCVFVLCEFIVVLWRFCVHGPCHEEAVEDLVRMEMERCDRLAGIFTMMSVAGGTGSGVGTYITQRLRDLYPNSFILNQVTWPYGAGEVVRFL